MQKFSLKVNLQNYHWVGHSLINTIIYKDFKSEKQYKDKTIQKRKKINKKMSQVKEVAKKYKNRYGVE